MKMKDFSYDKLYRGFILIMCMGFLGCMGYLCIIHNVKLDGATLIVAFFIALATTISQFDWGSSDGSKTKQKLLNQQHESKNITEPET